MVDVQNITIEDTNNQDLEVEEIVMERTSLHCDAVGESQCYFCGSFETITIRDAYKGDGYICLPCNRTSVVGTSSIRPINQRRNLPIKWFQFKRKYLRYAVISNFQFCYGSHSL